MSKSAEHVAEVLQATLAGISTKDLMNELYNRSDVDAIEISDPKQWCVIYACDHSCMADRKLGREEVHSPAVILVVKNQCL